MPHRRKGKMFSDNFKCPKCGSNNQIFRYGSSAGQMTLSLCRKCRITVKVMAGKPPKKGEIKNKLIKMAAEMVIGKNIPSGIWEDWDLPVSVRNNKTTMRTIINSAESARDQVRNWGIMIRDIANSL